MEALNVAVQIFQIGDGLADRLGGGQAQGGVGLAECDQALVVIVAGLVGRIVQSIPLDGVDGVGTLVAVVIVAAVAGGLGAENLLAGLEQGDTLGRSE